MLLYLIRHGIAEEQSFDGSDAARSLTREGSQKTKRCAKGLATIIDPPSVILTSPKIRAEQTAQIFSKVLDCPTQNLDALANNDLPPILAALAARDEEAIALVGHQPTLGCLLEYLCFNRLTPKPRGDFVDLKKAGIACIHIQRRDKKLILPALLHWIVTPKILSNLK